MKKRLLMSITLVATLATLTGCGSKTKTLTCTQSSTTNGFTSDDKQAYKFVDNRVESATITSTISIDGDYSKYIDDYKSSAEQASDDYNKVTGFSAKVKTGTNKITVDLKIDAGKVDEDNRVAYHLNESYESMQEILTNQGYTCK